MEYKQAPYDAQFDIGAIDRTKQLKPFVMPKFRTTAEREALTEKEKDTERKKKYNSKSKRNKESVIHDPKTGKSYPKYSKQHYGQGIPERRPMSAGDHPIPLTDREFDEMYFKQQGNPYHIDPLTETNRAAVGREKLFEDTFYIPYAEVDNLSDEEKKHWAKLKKSYDKNIYESTKFQKEQAVKQYTTLKGYNQQQRQRFDKIIALDRAKRKQARSERRAIEKELYMLDKEESKQSLLGIGDNKGMLKAIKKRRKLLQGYLGQLPGGSAGGEQQVESGQKGQIVESRIWKGRQVHKLSDGSIVFADEVGM